MAGGSGRAGRGGRGAGGMVFAGVLGVIALAWAYTTFFPAGISLASLTPQTSAERELMDQLSSGESVEASSGGGSGSGGSSSSSSAPAELCEGAQSGQEGQDPQEVPQEAREGQMDPLGKLEEKKQGRVEGTALNFVTHVYGYRGSDAGAYAERVNLMIECPEFESSAGAEFIRSAVGELEDGERFSAAAFLDDVRIVEEGGGEIRAEASFRVGEGEGWDEDNQPELTGEVKKYRQELTLVPEEGMYPIKSAESPELVEEGG